MSADTRVLEPWPPVRKGDTPVATGATTRVYSALVTEAPGLLPRRLDARTARSEPLMSHMAPPRGSVSLNGGRLKGSLPLVGRTRELAALESLLEVGRSDGTSVVIVSGEGGVGKSRLAAELGISVNTVKFHLRNLYDKLGVNSRAQAIAFYYSTGGPR